MNHLRLIPIELTLTATLDEGGRPFEASFGATLHDPSFVADVVRETLAMTTAPPWGGYLAADGDKIIGTCAFKGAPDVEGAVEIAYFTFPPFEGRGYATEMARALLRLAAASLEVRRVVAHTLPEPNASTRVLEKVGLRFVGEVEDPEDGRVWRWEFEPRAA